MPSKTDCNYGTPVEGCMVKKSEIQVYWGHGWDRLGQEIARLKYCGKMDSFPVQLLFSWAPILFEPSCSLLVAYGTPENDTGKFFNSLSREPKFLL